MEAEAQPKRKEDEDYVKRMSSPYSRTPNELPPGDKPAGSASAGAETQDETESEERTPRDVQEDWLLQKASEIFTTSTDYLDSNVTNTWERNLAHFNNEHAPGSKMANRSFKRSKTFRPKTRSMTKASEAAVTNALFSTQDIISVEAEDKSNETQILSARINKSVVQYRLKRRMPWFFTTLGAFQSTKVYGLCISFQYWDYQQESEIVPAMDENGVLQVSETGTPLGKIVKKDVKKDEPVCDLVAPENFRFDPMCDWRNPAGTSPFLIYITPMYISEVLENMQKMDPKTGMPTWREHSIGSILSTRSQSYDRTRQAREGRKRTDPAENRRSNSYSTVWAHMNIVKLGGEDHVYWTLGTTLLLTEPKKLTEVFPHLRPGERPFVVGFSTVEAFRNYPAGDIEQSAPLQEEINELANQRMDNVKLALNKRYYVKRGSQVDLEALIRNVPGGGVMMNDPEKDIKTVDTRDVTGSSYQEQDRLGVEMDELTGTFSQQSVQNTANRKGGETKGGMDKMASGAGAVQDYGIKIFVESWVEPTLRQIVRLVQYYETDETILAIAAKNAEAFERFGVNELTDDLLRQELTLDVNVGIGNTDPQSRVQKLLFGIESSSKLPGMIEKIKSDEIANEIFGMLGYKDGTRFYRNEQEQAEFVKTNPPQPPMEVRLKELELDIRKQDNEARDERERMKLDKEAQISFAELALKKNMKLNDLMTKLGIDKMRDKTARDTAAASNATKLEEMALSRETGSGI